MEPKIGPKRKFRFDTFFYITAQMDPPLPPAMYETTPADRKVKSQTTYFISYTKNAMC